MREERRQLPGDVTLAEPVDLWGTIGGTLRVAKGGKVYVRRMVYGDVIVQAGGRCHVYGNVAGDLVVHEGAKVILSGMVGKDVINRGGRLHVDACARVVGKVTTRSGQTSFEKGGDASVEGV
jgi:cytoskeletal protein CcmA (bactofilin family)